MTTPTSNIRGLHNIISDFTAATGKLPKLVCEIKEILK
jgi:hypothetical protein